MRFETNRNFDRAVISASLLNNLEQLCETAFGKKHKTSRSHELRYGSKASIAVNPKNGNFRDFSSGEGGNVFKIAALAAGLNDNASFPEIIAASAQWLNIRPTDYKTSFQNDQSTAPKTISQKINDAQLDWHAASPIFGTPAELYLKSRRINKTPLDACRWHPIQRCILYPIESISTRCAGNRRITGVHKIYLDEKGQKREVYGTAKRIQGHKKENAVCFPGRNLEGEILIAEGAETALSIWLAFNGQLTVIASCGTAKALDLPEGRHVIVCRDDDKEFTKDGKPNDGADKAAKSLIKQALKRSGYAHEVWPLGKRTYSKMDFNDILIEYGAEFVKQTIEAQISRSICINNDEEYTIANMPNAIPDHVIRDIMDGKNHLHAGIMTVGVGKTEAIINSAIVKVSKKIDQGLADCLRISGKKIDELSQIELDEFEDLIVVSVPTHRLGKELADRITAKTGVIAKLYQSIEADCIENTNEPMCLRRDEIKPHRENFLNIESEICKTCPFAHTCAFQKQIKTLKAERVRVLIVSHALAQSASLPKFLRKRKIALWIMDESPLSSIQKEITVSIADLNEPLHPAIIEKNEKNIQSDKADMILPAEAFLSALDKTLKFYIKNDIAKIGAYDFAKTLAHTYYPELKKSGAENIAVNILDMLEKSMSCFFNMILHKADVKDWKQRDFNGRLARVISFISEIKEIAYFDARYGIDADRGYLPVEKGDSFKLERLRSGWQPIISIAYDEKAKMTQLKMVVSNLNRKLKNTPIIYMDATANIDLIEPIFGRKLDSCVKAEVSAPHAQFFQEASKAYSKDWLSKSKNLKKIAYFISKKSIKSNSVLVVTNKVFCDQLKTFECLKHCKFEHFNAVAGLDKYKDFEMCFVVGRPMPSPEGARDAIHALGGEHDDKLWHEIEKTRKIRINGQTWNTLFKAAGSNNVIANAFVEQTTSGQVIQALGRLRQIWRDGSTRCDTYILSDVVVPFAVELMNPAEVDDVDDYERIFERGVIFDTPATEADFSRNTKHAVSNRTLEERRAIYRDLGVDQTWKGSFIYFAFKRKGQGRKWETGLFDMSKFSVDQLKTMIEQFAGDLCGFEVMLDDIEDSNKLTVKQEDEYENLNFTPFLLIAKKSDSLDEILHPD